MDSLTIGGDHYKLAADFEDYAETQELVANDFIKEDDWAKRAILNIANMGGFSSDRTINQYAQEIWGIDPY